MTVYIPVLFFIPIMTLANIDLPDPTRPANYVEPKIQAQKTPDISSSVLKSDEEIDWVLSAVKISENDRLAVLNGELIRVGDDIGTARLISINSSSVIVDHGGKEIIVRLFGKKINRDDRLILEHGSGQNE